MTLRPTPLLPPKRLSTPRSARRVSPTDWGLLPGARAPTRAGLAPAGLVQLSGRTTAAAYELGITETTARQYLSGLYRRTGCLNAAQAAYRLGMGAFAERV